MLPTSQLWEFLVAAILGVVEGVTEFLPISSTGHLIVASDLLKFRDSHGLFEIVIQLGAVLAVVWLYRGELIEQVKTVTTRNGVQRLWIGIVIAFIPAALIGFLLDDWITEMLFSPRVVAVSLIVGGVILWWIEGRPQSVNTSAIEQISPLQAFTIGLAQITALIPGVSRSGATIVGGLLSGLDRTTATKFSFFLAMPTLGAATLYSLLKQLSSLNSDILLSLAVGMVVAFFVSLIVMKWLIGYVSTHNFRGFAIYRIIAGVVILWLFA